MSAPMSATLPAANAAPARRGEGAAWLRRTGVVLRSFAVFVALWWALAAWNGNPIQLPTPLAVAAALWELAADGELLEHAAVSTGRLLLSLVVATLLAVPLGFVMGLSPRWSNCCAPSRASRGSRSRCSSSASATRCRCSSWSTWRSSRCC